MPVKQEGNIHSAFFFVKCKVCSWAIKMLQNPFILSKIYVSLMHVWFFKQALLTWQAELNLVVFYISPTKGCCVEKVVWIHPS